MTTPAPKLSRFPRVPVIWVVPVVAAGVALWMLAGEWRRRGQEITIEFSEAAGLEPGQTKLEYKGVVVGEVKGVSLADDLGRVVVGLQLARNAETIAREGAQFWVVQPQIGLSGISGLNTLLSGAHLAVNLGTGAPAKHFKGLEAPPSAEKKGEGRAFFLETDRLGGLQVHAPVYYRDMKVGEVETARLSDDATGVQIRIRIQHAYVDLVRTSTRFWNAGGSPLQISLFGGGAQKKSLQSIITGAVEFATPDDSAAVAPDGGRFSLAKEAEGDWLKWQPRIPIKAPDTAPEAADQSKAASEMLGR